MFKYKTIILVLLSEIFITSCSKHEPLPDLGPIPPPLPAYYPYGGNLMVYMDSTKIIPYGSSGTYSLSCYLNINSVVLSQYATKYNRINVYSGSMIYGGINYPLKSFSKSATSGQVYHYRFTMVDTAGFESKSSSVYTVTIP